MQGPAALPAALERPAESRPEQRAELQRELEQQGHLLEAQSAVLKIVAKLVGPAVVHIETDVPPPDSNAAYNHARHVEESGSGVIIELKDTYYVLTNRHVIRGAAQRTFGSIWPTADASIRRRFQRILLRTWRCWRFRRPI